MKNNNTENFLLENMMYMLLEGRIDDLKRQNPNLHAEIDSYVAADPTPQKKFLPWLVSQHKKGNVTPDHPNLSKVMSTFEKHKNRIGTNDHSQFSFQSLHDKTEPLFGVGTKEEERQKSLNNDIEKIHSSPNLDVFHVKTQKASQDVYGGGKDAGEHGTTWCVSARSDKCLFDKYYGAMYTIHRKGDPKSPYAVHPEEGLITSRHNDGDRRYSREKYTVYGGFLSDTVNGNRDGDSEFETAVNKIHQNESNVQKKKVDKIFDQPNIDIDGDVTKELFERPELPYNQTKSRVLHPDTVQHIVSRLDPSHPVISERKKHIDIFRKIIPHVKTSSGNITLVNKLSHAIKNSDEYDGRGLVEAARTIIDNFDAYTHHTHEELSAIHNMTKQVDVNKANKYYSGSGRIEEKNFLRKLKDYSPLDKVNHHEFVLEHGPNTKDSQLQAPAIYSSLFGHQNLDHLLISDDNNEEEVPKVAAFIGKHFPIYLKHALSTTNNDSEPYKLGLSSFVRNLHKFSPESVDNLVGTIHEGLKNSPFKHSLGPHVANALLYVGKHHLENISADPESSHALLNNLANFHEQLINSDPIPNNHIKTLTSEIKKHADNLDSYFSSFGKRKQAMISLAYKDTLNKIINSPDTTLNDLHIAASTGRYDPERGIHNAKLERVSLSEVMGRGREMDLDTDFVDNVVKRNHELTANKPDDVKNRIFHELISNPSLTNDGFKRVLEHASSSTSPDFKDDLMSSAINRSTPTLNTPEKHHAIIDFDPSENKKESIRLYTIAALRRGHNINNIKHLNDEHVKKLETGNPFGSHTKEFLEIIKDHIANNAAHEANLPYQYSES